jgi:hypothetical protein
MDMKDKKTWHRRPGEVKIGRSYTVDINIMHYLLRGYSMFDVIKQHIVNTVDPSKIFNYEFETAEQQVIKDFDITQTELVTNITANELDYQQLAVNYKEIASSAPAILEQLQKEVYNPTENFWKNRNTIL